MSQITSLYVHKILSQVSAGVETADLLRPLGITPGGSPDSAQMVPSAQFYDFFASLVARDPHGLALPLRIGASMQSDEYGAFGLAWKTAPDRLIAKGHDVRIGSRSAIPAFDWNNEAGWDACLDGVSAVYVTYAPDLAMPGAADAIRAFVDLARRRGVGRLVLLQGRGEDEAQACERIVQGSGIAWTVVRASWFNQNFSEGAFIDMVLGGAITLPAGTQVEPFVDVDDIADVVVAALTEDHHEGQVYEVTGPRLMSIADVAADLSRAAGREIAYVDVPHEAFVAEVAGSGAPEDVVWMLDYLFSTVLDGRNAHLTDGVQRALGRPPKDFAVYAREVAATGVWSKAA